VNQRRSPSLRIIVQVSAGVEFCTGLALILDPALVLRLMLGNGTSMTDMALARFLGIALVCLGLACWPLAGPTENGRMALRALLSYNTLVPLYLTYVGVSGGLGGPLLWPAVALHAIIGLFLVRGRLGP